MYCIIKRLENITPLPVVLFTVLLYVFTPSNVFTQTGSEIAIGMRMPKMYDPRVNITEDHTFLGLTMDGARSPFLKNQLSNVKREVKIDSTGKNINFSEKMGDVDLFVPNYLPLEDYIVSRRQKKMDDMWTQTTVSRLSETSANRSGSQGLRIDIPVEIKSKAFQKIFGSGTVGLDVSGEINIKGGFRNEKRSEVKSALNRGSDNSFKMEQTQQFRVQGHIGDKVTIGIDQDSERTFDFDNNIKLQYEGYEDEVIQSVEAGNIALSLPGTRFVTFGGKSNGLFGIKTSAIIGNLKLTAIASQEKGEKKKLSLKGGASQEATQILDYQYKKGIYYFIDDSYSEYYLKRDANGNPGYDPNREIVDYEIYKSGPNYQTRYSESIQGWAFVPEDDDDLEIITVEPPANSSREYYKGSFVRLEKNKDYTIYPELGFIRLTQRLGDDEVLGIAYKDKFGRIRGTLDIDPTGDQELFVRMLKNKTTLPSDKIWSLEWKNVYDFGRGTPKDGFEMRIFYKPPSGEPTETVEINGRKMTWLEVFGLDKINSNGESVPDNIVDDNPWLISFANGEVYFPDTRPFDPRNEEVQKLLPASYRESAIYDTTAQNVITAASRFYIEVNSQKRSSEFSLGMNVIENSEEVTLNGGKLSRGTDYTIDYFSGRLMLLNESATAANANLEISYESNQLFQIDKKTILGVRAEYGLWDDSFIGATFLYLNERTLDQKVRVGKGPMRNMVWDINTSLAFEPFFLTRLANYIPFVDTRAASTLKFEGEIAQIIPNPNTSNNENTGDNDGVAYIDDFEATKRETPIGVVHQSWEYCSPPVGKYDYNNKSLANRGELHYYTPYVPTSIQYIWPNRDLNANVNQTMNILRLDFKPADLGENTSASWNGIQKSLSSGYSNQTESKFIEIWVLGDDGNLHIDMGQISEDIIPNGEYDTEDKLTNQFRNGILDEGEDIGLDGMSDKDPRAIAAGGDFWDLNNNDIKDPGEPYSNDNWSYSPQSAETAAKYQHVNGTEGNENAAAARTPDTEDLNGNGDVDLSNNYFQYTFSLRKDSPDTMYISGKSIDNKETDPDKKDHKWRQYRIPLNADAPLRTTVGSPDMSLIEYMRVWVDGFTNTETHSILIAEINLVGSDWKEIGIAKNQIPETYNVDDDSTVTITVVNTHDNPEYKAPPGVQGEVDRITRVTAREQSLVLKVDNLQPGYSGAIRKDFYDTQDYINYKTLKMFIYGKDPSGAHITRDITNIEFFFRMGADTNNYYEVRQPVYEGWNNNNIEIDLVELSQLKFNADSSWIDSTNANITMRRSWLNNGKVLTVRGNPALRNIRMLIAGLVNKPTNSKSLSFNTPFSGEVWMNELRLSNVKKDKGIAMRSRVDFGLADLIKINAELDKKDADFHNVAERFGTGDNEISGNINTTVNMEKFLPSQLGLSLPFSYTYAKSEATPKYIPGTDVEVTESLPASTLDSIKTVNEKKGMSISFGVNSRSQNFFVKHLLTKIKSSYSRNESKRHDSRTKESISTSESGSVTWGVIFGTNNYIKPFTWLGKSRYLTKITDTKFYFTPQSFTTQHSGTRNDNFSETRSGVTSISKAFILNRSYSLNFKIFESLSSDISRSYIHDLNGVARDTLVMQMKDGKFGLLTSISNNFGVKYNPKIFSWFTTNVSYTSGFKYGFNRQQKLAPRSGSLNRTYTASGNLNLGTLAKTIYRPNAKAKTPPQKTPRPAPATTPVPPGTEGAENEQVKKPNPVKNLFNFSLLGAVSGFMNVFDPFNVSYNKRDNSSVYGIEKMPVMGYQFGFQDSPGVGLDPALLGNNSSTSITQGSQSTNNSLGISSGISISRNLTISFKYDLSDALNENGKTKTGQNSSSSFLTSTGKDVLFPGWTISLRSLEKLPYVSRYFQRVTLDHNFNGKKDQTFEYKKDDAGIEAKNLTRTEKNSSFSPLVGVSMSMKNGITMAVRFNQSEKRSFSAANKSEDIVNSSDISITASYSKRSDFRIPLPFLRKKKLKNSVDMSFTFSSGSNKTDSRKEGYEAANKSQTSNWKIKPEMNYSFSDRVRGGMFFEMGGTKNKTIGDVSYKEFGINVNIAIRGN